MSETSDPLYAITMAAADLKGAAPEFFAKFLDAIKKLENRYKDDLTTAPAASIFNVQGQASLATVLRQRLEKCTEQRKNYQNRA